MSTCSLCGTDVKVPIVKNGWAVTVRALYPSSGSYRMFGAGEFEYNYLMYSVKLPSEEDDVELDFSMNQIIMHYSDLRKVFIVHDACWKALKAYFQDAPVPFDRVVDVFRLEPEEVPKELHLDPASPKMKTPMSILISRKTSVR